MSTKKMAGESKPSKSSPRGPVKPVAAIEPGAVRPGANLRPLGFGEPAPFVIVRSDVNPTFHLASAAGRWLVITLFGSLEEEASRAAHLAAQARASLFDNDNAAFFGVVARDDGALRSRDGYRYFFDNDFALSRAFGITDGEVYRPTIFVLDRSLRVALVAPIREMPTVLDRVQALIADEAPALFERNAPVLTVPNIFEADLCATLIRHYQERGGEVSGFMREVDGQTVLMHDETHKRRRDVLIEDELLRRATKQRIERRLLPMIERAFAWKATQMERYLVACYGDEEAGFFRAHRDNTTAGTAHRKFAVSINLNADYDGGVLRFPEFGTRTYKPPVGGATVFSCGLLHEATPVTRGQRYAFLPFLYDDAGAQLRAANLDKVKLP